MERRDNDNYSNEPTLSTLPSSLLKVPSYSKDSRDSPLPDLLVYVICVAGILISLNFFRLDLFSTLTRQAEQPVGIITFKYKAAQRRFSDRVLWDRLKKESPVYDGDFIRTAGLSEATVTFAGGTVIDLAENSLIQIHADDLGARVDISEGGVSAAASGGGLILASGGNRVTVEAGAVVRAGTDGGGFLYRVVEGNASFTGETGTAAAGTAALSPRPSARLLNPGTGTVAVPFRWSRINLDPAEPVRLEVAEDRNFTRIVFREELSGDTASAELGTGSYFWRVSASGAGPVSSLDTFPLKIIAAPAPVLISPAEGYQYRFRVKRPVVRFQWTEIGDAASYLLEAADNPGMASPALVREVQGTSLYLSELGPGTWYWRVRPVFPAAYEGVPGEGVLSSFGITQSGDLGAPALRSPGDRDVVNVAAGRGDFYFSWRGEAEARSYTILISAKPDLSDPLVTGTVGDNFYAYRSGETVITPGQYYWAVFQTDAEGNNSGLSPARSFTAVAGEVVLRTVFPPEGYTIGRTRMPDIRFTWKTNVPQETRFQISGDSGFSRLILDEAVSGESVQGRSLPEGTWYWRVQARGGAGFETPPRSFTVVPPLAAPVLVRPAAGERVMVQEGAETVFSWEAPPGAGYYHFRLYRAGDRTGAVYENNLVEGAALRLSLEAYPEGNYIWTVQSFAQESGRSTRRTGRLSEGAFSIRKIYPVILDYPDDGAELEGLLAYYEQGTVRWSQRESAAASRFILSRNRNLSVPAAAINNPPGTVTLPRLRAGDYYWTVRAETADGLDISAETPRLLRVLPIPLLPEAANRLPRDGAVITGAELRQNRRIVFSWDPVPGATGYFFSLEHEGRTVIPERIFRETAFVMEDLTLLDLGDFLWRVEAVLTEPVRERQEDEEELVRRGEAGENRFRVEFARPDIPDLPEPGLLYGRE
jgi:hypothetical protein